MKKCDVIIPVYNAYEYVERCIKSVLLKTDFRFARIILIDDKSPDERIMPLLLKFAKKNPDKIVLLKNEVNLGFVGTVNRGMKYTKNDVVLLNSDTEVTEGWLEGMQKIAYSEKMIATVTPLSNNNTPVRIPYFNKDNAIPEKWNLEDLAKAVRECSFELYPELPSSHGFCIYIKREALDTVGYFDEETFGKGYGEENDFCFRCFSCGYRHVLCDDVYVLHKGSQSFLDKGEMHNNELERMYPEIWKKVDAWFSKRDLRLIGENVAVQIEIKETRKNILILVKDLAELNLLDEKIQDLRNDCNIYVLIPYENNYKLKAYFWRLDLMIGMFERPMRVEDGVFERMYSRSYAKMVNDIVRGLGISAVFYRNFDGHFWDIRDICKEKKIELVEIENVENLKKICTKKGAKKKIDGEAVRRWMRMYSFFENCKDEEVAPIEDGVAKRILRRVRGGLLRR